MGIYKSWINELNLSLVSGEGSEPPVELSLVLNFASCGASHHADLLLGFSPLIYTTLNRFLNRVGLTIYINSP